MSHEKLLAAACIMAAVVVLLAMHEREKHWRLRSDHGHIRKEDLLWPARHAARWLCVATLLLTALQHWRAYYDWWPALTSALKFLPDVLLVVFGFVYGAAVFTPKWLTKYAQRKVKKTAQ